MTTMLEFYQQHEISPVRQVIPDLNAHYARRAVLYRALGLPPLAIQGKRILEIGPGSGENARYTLSLQPYSYVMVEPNDTARKALEATFAGSVTIVDQKVETYKAIQPFDVVLCEGLLGLAGRDPRGLLGSVRDTVKVGGVLVITCIDPISNHTEVLRRAMAQPYLKLGMSLAEQVQVLTPVFTPHLATLKGMTRTVEDWIIDNLLSPASIGPTFSIPDAIEALGEDFAVLGCSPRFLLDWRWYKEADSSNQWAVDSYWRQCHNLLDYRKIELGCAPYQNEELMNRCLDVREQVALGALRTVHWETNRVEADPGWFGRGQQYLSFVRLA